MGTIWITGGLLVVILVLLDESGFVQAHGTGSYGAAPAAGYGAAPYGAPGYSNAAATCTPEIRTAIALFLSTQGANLNNPGNISPAIAPLFSLCFPMFPLLLNNNNNNNGLAALAPFLMTGGFGLGGFGFPAAAPPLALAGAGAAPYGGGGY